LSTASTLNALKRQAKRVIPRTWVRSLRQLPGVRDRFSPSNEPLPALPPDAGIEVRRLLQAWELAQASDANAPGSKLAYYSFDFDGVRFPGERPWSDRWDVLKDVTSFRGKRLLELGCNLGILSSQLMREREARAALAVDCDAQIIEGAKLVAAALGVDAEFQPVDFDATTDWETPLKDFQPDVVFALSVLNWVRNKDRFLSFLGEFDEVIFEGHDSASTERKKLRNAGFREIQLVTFSERDRPVFRCRK